MIENPDPKAQADAAFQQALALHQQGRLGEAQGLYERALQLQPEHSDAWHSMGVLAAQSNDPLRAIELIGKAIALDPRNAAAHNNQGNTLRQLGRHEAAVRSYDAAIALEPGSALLHFNRANSLCDCKRDSDAISSYDQALELEPEAAELHCCRGNALRRLGRPAAAVKSYDRAIALDPGYAECYVNRGHALAAMKQDEAAIQDYEKAIALEPGHVDTYVNRGVSLAELGRYEAAVQSYDRAIALKPDHAEAHGNRGNALAALRRHQEAIASYDSAIALRSGYAEAHSGRGNALRDLHQHAAAIASYDRAIALRPDYANAYHNRGNAYREIRHYEAAIQSYERAMALNPDLRFLRGMLLHTRMQICDWEDFAARLADLTARIDRDEAGTSPFPLLGLSGSAQLQRKAAELWARELFPANRRLPAIPKRPHHGRLRIGYFSADFRNHPLSYLMAGVFENHDRSTVELTAFSFGPDTRDDMRKRLETVFDRFIDVRNRSDEDVALLARQLEIDVAVDLGGFTQHARAGIFAARAAPLQVGLLGYPGTTGTEYVDYLIGDRTVVPGNSHDHYSEKIAYLPNSYWPSSYRIDATMRDALDKGCTREEAGLPPTGFVFCCFNNSYKITPGVFDAWMRILGRVGGSVLWLLQDNPSASANLQREAAKRGLNPQRLVFAGRLPLAEHLARHRIADLFLDTLPYNAHTTASDALWAGLPVLTCTGGAFAGRVAASLLNAIGLPELITATPAEYEDLAVELAGDSRRLARIRRDLGLNRDAATLFDTPLYTRNLEAAFVGMYQRYHADLRPAHLYI